MVGNVIDWRDVERVTGFSESRRDIMTVSIVDEALNTLHGGMVLLMV